jgi:iron complex outermembrane receptor protein
MRTISCGISCLALAMGMAMPAHAQGGGEGGASTNDVIVTGSLIKRSEGFQSSSPVDVVSRDTLEALAPSTVASFLKDLPQNFGSTFSSGRASGGASVGGERGAGTINLRGLGPSSTLVLLNGRRQTQVPDAADNVVDVNSLVPEIAIQRIEVLKDGASAIYGTDAVAGVVNMITADNFDGVRASARINMQTYSGKGDRRFEAMFGTGLGEKTRIMVAGSYMDQDELNLAFDIPSQKGSENNVRSTVNTANPGEFTVPLRNAAGALISGANGVRRNVLDPTCGQITSTQPTDSPTGSNLARILPIGQAVDCRYFINADQSAQSRIRQLNTIAVLTHEFSSAARFRAELNNSTSTSYTRYTVSDVISLASLVVPGHNPGSEFRAVNANGQPLYAVSSGVSAGYARDGATVFLPSRNSAGQVILTANPTDPTSGIPFYEDVVFNGRLLNSQGNLPTGNSYGPGEYAAKNMSRADTDVFRIAGELSGDLSDNWSYQTALTYSRYKLTTNGAPGIGLTEQVIRALDGRGGPTCNVTGARNTNGCEYFNIYGNSVFATGAGNPRANSEGIINYVAPMLNDRYESSLLVGDAILSGSLLELPAGPLGIALGYQYRKSTLQLDFDANKNVNNTTINAVQKDFDASRDVNAFFGEVNVPVMDGSAGRLELNGAIRHETGEGIKTTDPKLGAIYTSPGNGVSLRASYGTSFVAPSLFRLFSESATTGSVSDCARSVNPVCTGIPNIRVSSRVAGNPNLKPQTSKAWNVGGTVRPLDGLSASLDWFHFKFDNLIATESATDLVNMDPTGALTGRVFRDAANQPIGVILQYFNAASVTASGLDFDVNYRLTTENAGNFGFQIAGTYLPVYRWQIAPNAPEVNWAGETNDRRVAQPSPKWRANARLSWESGPSSLMVQMRYTGSLKFSLDPTQRIRAYTPVDISYTHRLSDGLGSTIKGLTAAIGATNVFAQKEPFIPYPGFQPFIGSLHDQRGRFLWAKLTADF